MTRIPMPFVYDDDPDDTTSIPRANDLDYVEVADVSVLKSDDAVTFMEKNWSDDDGVCTAWITVRPKQKGDDLPEHAFIDHVRNYA